MDAETEKRFHEYIKPLPPSSGKFITPEQPERPEISAHKDMTALIKELHNISQELNTLNQILRRKKS